MHFYSEAESLAGTAKLSSHPNPSSSHFCFNIKRVKLQRQLLFIPFKKLHVFTSLRWDAKCILINYVLERRECLQYDKRETWKNFHFIVSGWKKKFCLVFCQQWWDCFETGWRIEKKKLWNFSRDNSIKLLSKALLLLSQKLWRTKKIKAFQRALVLF